MSSAAHPGDPIRGRTDLAWDPELDAQLRYGLPAILRVGPRPSEGVYSDAAKQSMRSDHRPMFDFMLAELRTRI